MITTGNNKYVGARYVPIFDGEWDIIKKYEPLTIVSHGGDSYTSKTYIPNGVEINNEKYWAKTGNYNAQVEQYRTEVLSLQKKLESEISILNFIIPPNNDITNIINDIISNTNFKTILLPKGDFYISTLDWFTKSILFKGVCKPQNQGENYSDGTRLHITGNTGLIYSDNNEHDNYGLSFENITFVCTSVGGVIEFNQSVTTIEKTLSYPSFRNCFFVGNDANTKGFILANGIMQAQFENCSFYSPGGWAIDICGDINNFYHCQFSRTRRMLKTKRLGTFGSQNSFRDCDFEVRRSATENNYIMEIGDYYTNFDNCYYEVGPSIESPTEPSTTHPTYNKIKGWCDFSNAFEVCMKSCRFDIRSNFIKEQLFKFNAFSRVYFENLKDIYGEDTSSDLINPNIGFTNNGSYITWDFNGLNGKVATFFGCSAVFMRYINQFNKFIEIKDGYYPTSKNISTLMSTRDRQFLKTRKKVFNFESRFFQNEVSSNGVSYVESEMKYPISIKRQKDTALLQPDLVRIYDVLPTNELYYIIKVGCEGNVNDTMKVLVRTKDSNGNTVETPIDSSPVFTTNTNEKKYLLKITNTNFSYIYYQIDVINDSGAINGWAMNYVEVEPQSGVINPTEFVNYNPSLVSPNCYIKA